MVPFPPFPPFRIRSQDFDVFNALDVMENESFLKEP